ncbi:MAG: carboxypeptidase regulatory-like domain-containing protein [Bacteroidota bacterium]|nr:carboxypeptidase regulatory-like domain-containing protein [Bacteroidota bacterium]MDW8138630.1 carboxypeptidase regulatory-like domain-containing protein [Bacteroidota bacterium]
MGVRAISVGLSCLFLLGSASVLWAQGGTIRGKVYFEGNPIRTRPISMKQDKACDALHGGKTIDSEEFVLNSDNTLQNVIVYAKTGTQGKVFRPVRTVAVLDQVMCMYTPRVLAVMTGQPVEIRNSDPLLHNVHFTSRANGEFNIGQPTKGVKMTRQFDRAEGPGSATFKCDVHPWMRAYLAVFDHPVFAVTGKDGSFTIRNVPAGTYVLEAWHERLGAISQNVTVRAGQTVEVDFKFVRR